MTAVMDIRTSKVLPSTTLISLSQVLLNFANGRSLNAVDTEITELQSKLSDPAMAGRIRRPARLRETIVQLEGERRFITRTMSAARS